jgi:general secretion pathway protein L
MAPRPGWSGFAKTRKTERQRILSILYIRLPSKAAAESADHWAGLDCPYALVSNGGAVEREGASPLPGLGEFVAKAARVVLVVAASDVTMLRVQAPPMSAARLKAALPNLVEDQLMTDPAECVVVAGAESEGLRTVAVVDRAWLDILARGVTSLGAHHVAAVPAQLCLPWQEGVVTAAVTEHGGDIDLALRLSEQNGIGLPIWPEQGHAAAQDVIEAMLAVVPNSSITLYVPQAAVPSYQEAAARAPDVDAQGAERTVNVYADNWSRWIGGAQSSSLDLMSGLAGAARGQALDWRRWRWPVALAAAALTINIIGLNVEWLRMKREATALRASLTQIYKTAFPRDPVIVDPVVQMKQKIAAAKHNSGQAAPDDFTTLTAAFGEAWNEVLQQGGRKPAAAIAGLEYRERSLLVRLKPEGDVPTDQMKAAMAARDLTLTPAPAQAGAVVWQIRSAK